MSVCSETFLLQNLLPLVCADCWEWPPILSYLKCLPQVFTFVSFLGTWSAWGRANASSKLCICLTNQYERCHDSLINPQKHWLCTDAGDWRMSVSAVLTVIVTVHQLIFFFFCLCAKAHLQAWQHCQLTVYQWGLRQLIHGGCRQSFSALQNVLMRKYEKEIKMVEGLIKNLLHYIIRNPTLCKTSSTLQLSSIAILPP